MREGSKRSVGSSAPRPGWDGKETPHADHLQLCKNLCEQVKKNNNGQTNPRRKCSHKRPHNAAPLQFSLTSREQNSQRTPQHTGAGVPPAAPLRAAAARLGPSLGAGRARRPAARRRPAGPAPRGGRRGHGSGLRPGPRLSGGRGRLRSPVPRPGLARSRERSAGPALPPAYPSLPERGGAGPAEGGGGAGDT